MVEKILEGAICTVRLDSENRSMGITVANKFDSMIELEKEDILLFDIDEACKVGMIKAAVFSLTSGECMSAEFSSLVDNKCNSNGLVVCEKAASSAIDAT